MSARGRTSRALKNASRFSADAANSLESVAGKAEKLQQPARGFTLLEVAVALAILGVGIVSCLQIFGASLRMQDRASRESRAVLHARAVMDALLFQPEVHDHQEERDTAEGFHTRILVRHAGLEEGLTDKAFNVESEFTLRYLQVDVDWQDATGRKTYTVKSMRMAPENE